MNFLFFFELVGADAAQGALVIGGQFIAFVDIATDGADKLLHVNYLTFESFNCFSAQII